MTHSSTAKPADELAEKGYLTVYKFVEYLKDYPLRAASYPIIMKMVKDGRIGSTQVGKQHRITREDIDYYLEHGMKQKDSGGASAPLNPDYPAWLGVDPPSVEHLKSRTSPVSKRLAEDDADDIDL